MKTILVRYLRSAAPRAYYSIFLNTLGLNAARTIIYNWLWKCRKAFTPAPTQDLDLVAELDREGIIKIENFLPEDEFNKILEAYNNAEFEENFKDNPNVPQFAYRQITSFFKCEVPSVENYIIKNKRLQNLIKSTSFRKINVFPKIVFEKFYVDNETQIMKNSPERSDALHYDVPFNSMRAFLYLKPCNDRNAAFIYGKKTHKYDKKRIKFEYFDSIKQSVKRTAIKGAPLDEIDEDLLKELGHVPTDMTGNANTLVIFNSMGFHKRGQFKEIGSRQAILIDYRTLDTPLNFWSGVPIVRNILQRVVAKKAA